MKKIYCLIFLLTVGFIHADQSDDLTGQGKVAGFRDRFQHFMKFRGSVSFVFDFWPPYYDGIKHPNHMAQIVIHQLDYTDKGDPGEQHHTEKGRLIRHMGFELKLYLKYSFIMPFLAVKDTMFENNNIEFNLMGEISPISLNIGSSVIITPAPFLKFESGFLIGPAWRFANLAAGLGINTQEGLIKYDFAGPHLQVWLSSTFQIDLAYLVPEKIRRWAHVVFFTTPRINYRAFLGLSENQPYLYENSPGEHFNGWFFSCNFFLGYQLPIIEDDMGEDRPFIKLRHKNFRMTTGIMTNIEKIDLTHFNKSRIDSGGWGSDFVKVEFGPIVRLELPFNYWVILFFFFANDRAYTDETTGNIYFEDRDYDDWYIHFRRVGFFIGWNF